MPDYSTIAPPQSLQPGGVFYSFGSIIYPGPSVPSDRPPFTTGDPTQEEVPEPIPAAPQAGQRCALTQPVPAFNSGGRAVTYEAEFNSAPTTASISLQGATLRPDGETNRELYGYDTTNREILTGDFKTPVAAGRFEGALNRDSARRGR